MVNPTLVILAAGMGRRFGGNKQIEAVGPGGEFILHYSIFDALISGFEHIVLVTRPELLAVLQAEFSHHSFPVDKFTYIFQETTHLPAGIPFIGNRQKPWGTAHAVWCCRDVVKSPFAVVNADDFYGRSTFDLLASFLSSLQQDEPLFGLVGYSLDKTVSEFGFVSRAICHIDESGYLSSIKEQTRIFKQGLNYFFQENNGLNHSLAANTCVSMNCWAFTPAFFNDLEQSIQKFLSQPSIDLENYELFLPDVIGYLIMNSKIKVKVLPGSANWFGITNPQDIAAVKHAIQQFVHSGVYPENFHQYFTPEQNRKLSSNHAGPTTHLSPPP